MSISHTQGRRPLARALNSESTIRAFPSALSPPVLLAPTPAILENPNPVLDESSDRDLANHAITVRIGAMAINPTAADNSEGPGSEISARARMTGTQGRKKVAPRPTARITRTRGGN